MGHWCCCCWFRIQCFHLVYLSPASSDLIFINRMLIFISMMITLVCGNFMNFRWKFFRPDFDSEFVQVELIYISSFNAFCGIVWLFVNFRFFYEWFRCSKCHLYGLPFIYCFGCSTNTAKAVGCLWYAYRNGEGNTLPLFIVPFE